MTDHVAIQYHQGGTGYFSLYRHNLLTIDTDKFSMTLLHFNKPDGYLFSNHRSHVTTKKKCRQACNFTKKETLAHVFSCVFCEISINFRNFRTPSVAASEETFLLFFLKKNMLTFSHTLQIRS